jgi:hypothetical protein
MCSIGLFFIFVEILGHAFQFRWIDAISMPISGSGCCTLRRPKGWNILVSIPFRRTPLG